MKIDAIIVAAGPSRRFGGDKTSAVLCGHPILHYPLMAAVRSRCRSVTAVVASTGIADILPHGVLMIVNENPGHGMSSSIIAGIRSIPEDSDGVLIIPGDEPLLQESLLDRLISACEEDDGSIASCTLSGKPVSPAVFPRSYFQELIELRGDSGGREVLLRHRDRLRTVPVDEWQLMDVDLPEDLREAEAEGLRRGILRK